MCKSWVHGWRVHGHEFSDDNATSLLVHGDLAASANTTYFDAKGYQFDGTNDNIDYGDLHGAINYVTFAGWWFCGKHVDNGALFAKRSATENAGDYFLRQNASGTLEFDAYTGSGWQGAVDSTVPIPIGRVFHFALQYSSDGTGLAKMFLDVE